MLIVSPSTGIALASHAAERSYVMFVQGTPAPNNATGPILVEGIKGTRLGARLAEIASLNAHETFLIGLYETARPEQDAYEIRSRYEEDRLHDWWFEPSLPLVTFIQTTSQSVLQDLLAQAHPGALSTDLVDIDEIARMLGVSVKTIRRWVSKKQMPFLRLSSGALRFVPADVIASLRR